LRRRPMRTRYAMHPKRRHALGGELCAAVRRAWRGSRRQSHRPSSSDPPPMPALPPGHARERGEQTLFDPSA